MKLNSVGRAVVELSIHVIAFERHTGVPGVDPVTPTLSMTYPSGAMRVIRSPPFAGPMTRETPTSATELVTRLSLVGGTITNEARVSDVDDPTALAIPNKSPPDSSSLTVHVPT